jgi:thiopurine S-methyltransferase
MDPAFWHDRWRANDIGFHQPAAHAALKAHWPNLGLPKQSNVFVPLAGKSLDMVWMAERGHQVIGVELSELAVDNFFAERSRAPASLKDTGFTIKRAGPYEIWCGDFFELSMGVTRRVVGVYDRAALVAMPYAMQARYAGKLAELIPCDVPVLLVSLSYDPSEMDGPPFPISRERIFQSFSQHFSVDHLEDTDGLAASPRLKARGLSRLIESVYLLRRNGRAYG